MKILITGHKGLSGNGLLKHYQKDNKIVTFDIGDNLKEDNYDLIIHCAARCVIRELIEKTTLMMDNINVTYEVMELARRCNCKKVILLSSNRLTPNLSNPYTVGKIFLEEIAKAYKNCYDIDYLIIRPETIWGPNDNPIRVMPNWIDKALHNKDLIIYGDENKELSPLYIDDFIIEFSKLLENFNEIKNSKPYVITGVIRNAKDIAKIIIKTTVSKSKIIYEEAEITQPQQIILNEINEVRKENDLEGDIKKYI